ncbi:hypothetical protein [Nonomuraea sp. NPDC002799]
MGKQHFSVALLSREFFQGLPHRRAERLFQGKGGRYCPARSALTTVGGVYRPIKAFEAARFATQNIADGRMKGQINMSDNDLAAGVDLTLVDDVERMVRGTAEMICAEQPDVPQPESLHDLDSFSMVQVLLELENVTHLKLLERFEGFEGETFRDLAEFIVRFTTADDAAAQEKTPA